MLRTDFVNTQEWVTDLDPIKSDEYMVTFQVTKGDHKTRGLDVIPYELDEEFNGWGEDKSGWYTEELKERFPDSEIRIVAWMPLPEICEDM